MAAVLSGNRNFEGRIHPDVRLNYLASPPLVVAYALAGTMDVDLTSEPIGDDADGNPVMLSELWPPMDEVNETIRASLTSDMFRTRYAAVFDGDEYWRQVTVAEGETYAWQDDSTYVKNPPFFESMTMTPAPVTEIVDARVLVMVGDSVTTDHISPAGSIGPTTPAGRYLTEHGVGREDFNSYGARRGNHEVMMRGTFANVRLRNQLAPGTEGGVTIHLPDGVETSIYEAAMQYASDQVPLVVLAGREYGTGSSRDWAAKGTALLGVRAVIAQSLERIHRSNLIGMGVVPLQFYKGDSAASLGLTGRERFSITGLDVLNKGEVPKEVTVTATTDDGDVTEFRVIVRIDTPMEAEYYRHGGILQYVLRQMAGRPEPQPPDSARSLAGARRRHDSLSNSRTSPTFAARSRTRHPESRLPHHSSSTASGNSAQKAATSSASRKTCRCPPSGGMVAKILPPTRNEVMS